MSAIRPRVSRDGATSIIPLIEPTSSGPTRLGGGPTLGGGGVAVLGGHEVVDQ